MAQDTEMKIEQIYVYPIKSLRGVSVDSTTLTSQGFPYDRSFMLLEVVEVKDNDKATNGGQPTYKNMSIASYNSMCRFVPTLNTTGEDPTMTVTFHPLNGDKTQSIPIPLSPDTAELEEIDVVMHLSPTKAYKMPAKYNDWFAACFGHPCVLAYISDNLREVRMSSPRHRQAGAQADGTASNGGSGWLSSLSSMATNFLASAPEEVSTIRFADCAPYLVVSSKSMDSVHARLPAGEEFDITKFRPNIVVSGAQKAWEEDFWAELSVDSGSSGSDTAKTRVKKIELEHNCGRCRSINVDFETGAQGTGEAGKMLKKLASDRRVDVGSKWSPVFGRYAFLHPDSEKMELRVGEGVKVTRTNGEHTKFDWKGLSTLPGGGKDE
ncbi:hypothetical protein BDY17DRAFT_11492 [Neohortaea acidophila]|uniref:MOSC domain-containing protein n=1 Tax=Neohortaea acidophila TaxID=245834 RepID=A0A6A6Q569_9PEZI|nr:uncharacterized protein BDY17DRAFT_11492 [Neohortaea acidophila]KAF2487442.1 hypothetical protein BDY17DRAFT_11492 [Neohortaea acidophila]